MARGRGESTPKDQEHMQIISRNINSLLSEKGITQAALSRGTGIPASTLTGYVKGTSLPIVGNVQKIADFFNVDKASIDPRFSKTPPKPSPGSQTPTDELTEAITGRVVQLDTPRKKVVLEVATEQLEEQQAQEASEVHEEQVEYHVYERLSAGRGTGYTEGYNYDTVYYDEDISHDLASWIYGDSMEPAYLNGEVALIKATGFDYDGAVYAIDWAGQTYIKKVYKEKDGLRLVSLNKKYAPLFAHMDEEPRIIGKVIGHFMPTEG